MLIVDLPWTAPAVGFFAGHILDLAAIYYQIIMSQFY